MSELLSCPFCGGEAEWAKGKYGDGTDWDYIACSKCEAIGPSASVQLEGKALDWNQRQPHPDEELAEQFRLGFEAGRKDAMRQQAMEQEQLEGLE